MQLASGAERRPAPAGERGASPLVAGLTPPPHPAAQVPAPEQAPPAAPEDAAAADGEAGGSAAEEELSALRWQLLAAASQEQALQAREGGVGGEGCASGGARVGCRPSRQHPSPAPPSSRQSASFAPFGRPPSSKTWACRPPSASWRAQTPCSCCKTSPRTFRCSLRRCRASRVRLGGGGVRLLTGVRGRPRSPCHLSAQLPPSDPHLPPLSAPHPP